MVSVCWPSRTYSAHYVSDSDTWGAVSEEFQSHDLRSETLMGIDSIY